MTWHPPIVDISHNMIRRPFISAVEDSEVVGMDLVPVVLHGRSRLHNGVMAVDAHVAIVVRNGQRQNPVAQLPLAADKVEQLDHPTDGQRHAVSILAVGDSKSLVPTFHFACQKRKMHQTGAHERRLAVGARPVTNVWAWRVQLKTV